MLVIRFGGREIPRSEQLFYNIKNSENGRDDATKPITVLYLRVQAAACKHATLSSWYELFGEWKSSNKNPLARLFETINNIYYNRLRRVAPELPTTETRWSLRRNNLSYFNNTYATKAFTSSHPTIYRYLYAYNNRILCHKQQF